MSFPPPDDFCSIDPYEHYKISLNPDGTLTRCQYPTVPATTVDNSLPGEAVSTKDVTINEDTKTWMRIYLPNKLPSNDNKVAKLPLVIYFHAGGFILYQTDTMFNNEPCGRFATEVPSIVASVNYRLAPENRLPAAYEDAIDALQWIKKQALDKNGDPWLRDYADFSRCYLMGCSSGGNIVYRTALTAQELDLGPLRISGIILNQPIFGGIKRTKSEIREKNDTAFPISAFDLIWNLALPPGSDRDHEYSNPLVEGKYSKNIESLPRTLVRGFDGDPQLDRQMEFVKMLIKRGVQVTAHFGEFGFHCIDMIDAKSHLIMIQYMRDFI